MNTLLYLLQKEFRQIFRNPAILRMIIAMPVLQLLILPLAADYEIKNIKIAVVDQDHSAYSRKLTSSIVSSGYFLLTAPAQTYKQAFEQMEQDKADLILEIPQGFERNLVREGSQELFVAVNAINGTKANVGGAYLGRIISEFNGTIRTQLLPLPAAGAQPIIDIVQLNWYNPFFNYRFFMIPGILVSLVTMIGAYMCALNIVKEKESGTIEQLNVTPIKKHHFILGKMIPFWIVGMLVFTIGLFGVGWLVFGIAPVGSIFVLYCFLALYLVAVLGIGLLISTYSDTQQQAMSLAFFFIMIFQLMSGLFTSVDSMPEWAKWVARFNPVTYFIEVMRMVVMKGSGFSDIRMHFVIMLCFALVFNTWAVWNYKKTS